MTTETLTFPFAGGDTCYGPQGRIWYIKSAPTGPLSVICRKSGAGSTNVRMFTTMPAGAKFKADPGDGWDILEIRSASAQNVEMIIGDDDVEIAQAVSVTGNASTIERPCASFSNIAPIVTGAVQAALFAANLNRRRITVTAHSTNTASVMLRVAGTANSIYELQPGLSFTYANTAALDYFDGVGGQTVMIAEEL